MKTTDVCLLRADASYGMTDHKLDGDIGEDLTIADIKTVIANCGRIACGPNLFQSSV
jgi:hypothetical protein